MRLLLLAASLAIPSLAAAQSLPRGLKLSEETSFEIAMTTTFVVPADRKSIDQLRVYHALPTKRPWTDADWTFGAIGLKKNPQKANLGTDNATGAHYLLWTTPGPLRPGQKLVFVSEFRTISHTREFLAEEGAATWKDFADPKKNGLDAPRPESAAAIHPELASLAEGFKRKFAPAPCVLAMCKWIRDNLRYDASVPHAPTDVASTLRTRCGHCGHQQIVFEQLAASAGIPVRRVAGMNLYAEDGRSGDLQKVRSDFTNVHTWMEAYFPGIGWIEVDPGEGDRAFRLSASLIQNNRWFQNYAIWMREGSEEKQPAWIARRGGFDSDCGVEHIIRFARRSAKP